MKVEFIKEEKFGRDAWYEVRVDGLFKHGSFNKDEVEKVYAAMIKDPFLMDPKKTILKSEEIYIPLIEE